MIAYKLFRKLRDGSITSLFIDKSKRLPIGEWMDAECHPTKGYKVRPYWHCTSTPHAPHLTNKGRVWMIVKIEGVEEFSRPQSQGGKWYLANRLKILKEV